MVNGLCCYVELYDHQNDDSDNPVCFDLRSEDDFLALLRIVSKENEARRSKEYNAISVYVNSSLT